MTFPDDVDGFIAMTGRLVRGLDKRQAADDLFSAVLATVHVADWYHRDITKCDFDSEAKAAFAARYPAWDILRQLGNGTKHAVPKPQRVGPDKLDLVEVKWEQPDAWDHVGSERTYWVVEHQGQSRSIYTLCRTFLDELKTDIATRSSAP